MLDMNTAILNIGGLITLAACMFGMLMNARTMRQEALKASNEQIKLQTETARDIRENTAAITRVVDSQNKMLSRMDATDKDIRELQLHNVKIAAEMKRIDGRAEQAFNRNDERKREIEEVRAIALGARS